MKVIYLNKLETIGSANETPQAVIRAVMEVDPKGMSLDQMRRRIHVMDALDKCKDGILRLEDNDHAMLAEALKSYPWLRASSALLAMIDAVVDAKGPVQPVDAAVADKSA